VVRFKIETETKNFSVRKKNFIKILFLQIFPEKAFDYVHANRSQKLMMVTTFPLICDKKILESVFCYDYQMRRKKRDKQTIRYVANIIIQWKDNL